MRPPNPSAPTIEPRSFLREHGLEMFAETLRVNARYVCQQRPLKALAKSLRRAKPLYVAGKRGTGKTALARGFAQAFNLPVKVLQCMEDLDHGDVLAAFDAAAQGQFVAQRLAAGGSFADARAGQWTLEFLDLGSVLEVYHYANTALFPPVLILDEVDKLGRKTRHKLLQVLDEGYATIPRLRPRDSVGITSPCAHPPIVIMTSNNMDESQGEREASAPFRSRCYVVSVKEATLAEQVLILSTSVPEAPEELLCQVVKMLRYVSHQGSIIDKPEIREAKDLLITLVDEGVKSLDTSVIDDNICCLAKSPGDEVNMIDMAKAMERAAHRPDDETERIVAQAFAKTRALVGAEDA